MTSTLEAPAWEEIDPFIEAYEQCQARHGQADLAGFLPDPAHPHYRAVLRELVRADLEYGWRRGQPRRAEDYLAAFPALRADPAGLSAVAFEEYRQRSRAGEKPSPGEYRARLGVETAGWPVAEASTNNVRAPALDIESVATTYLGQREGLPEARNADFSLCPGAGDCDSARLFAELLRSDPEAALQLARAVTSLPKTGRSFLGFRLVEEIGRGAFGRVFLALQGDLADRPVALKVSPDLAGESRSLARLQHTNIVPVYSVHRAGALQALCMPYFGSTTLELVLRERREGESKREEGQPLPPTCLPLSLSGPAYVREVLRVVARLADGLAYAHERGILHQDLKPANVLLGDDGTPMLLDFNLAQDTRLPINTATALLGGTLPYMAPEHLEAFRDGRLHADFRSDLYSLGLILYELLAGRPPFQGDNLKPVGTRESLPERLSRILQERRGEVPDPRHWNRSITPAVASIVRHCLEPDLSRRYQSARQLGEDIERHLNDQPLRWAPEPSLPERTGKWARRHPRLTSGYAVASVAGLLLLGAGLLLAGNLRRLERAEAVQTRRLFSEELTRSRFLLGGPAPSDSELAEGTQLARQALARYGVIDDPDWDAAPAATSLGGKEHDRLRGDRRELLLLLGRGVRLQASAADRERSLAEALRLNELAGVGGSSDELLRPVLLQRSLLLHEMGCKQEARVLLEQAESLPLRTARDLYLAAVEQMARGDFRRARDLLVEARRLNPQNAFILYSLGLCHALLGAYHKAAAALDASIALWPDFFASHYQRGRAHHELKEHAEAVAEFDTAIHQQPDYLDAYIDRALARSALKDYQRAEADLTHALEAGTLSTRVYFIRANVRRLAGNGAGADADRLEGLKHEPRDAVSWVARGLARLEDRNPKGALADLDRALEVNPHYLPALEDRAAILAEHLGQTAEAVKALDRAIELSPERAQNRAGRGVLLARLGQRDEALRDAKEAERLDPRPMVLYQAAGIWALTSRQKAEDGTQAYRLLRAALRGGVGYDLLEADPDLHPIRSQPEFRQLVGAARALH